MLLTISNSFSIINSAKMTFNTLIGDTLTVLSLCSKAWFSMAL